MLKKLKEHGPDILTEAAGNLIPFGDVAIAIYQLLQSTIAKEQAIATLNWIKETDEQSLRIGPRDILIDPVSNLLDSELYRKADEANRSSMFGAPTSVIYNGKLVQ